MKNIANYLEDYFDEDSGIYETVIRSKKDINKESMKAFKRGSREDEINAHGKPINYNHTFRALSNNPLMIASFDALLNHELFERYTFYLILF